MSTEWIKVALCKIQEWHLASARRNSCACNPVALTVLGAGAQTTLSKGLPDLTLVGSLGKGLVRIEDGITSLDEVGVAGLPVSLLA